MTSISVESGMTMTMTTTTTTTTDRPSPSFWRRHWFDLSAGILLPGLCLVFDPIVFRDGEWGIDLYSAWAIPVYCFMGFAALCLLTWLVCRRPPAFLAGCMFGAAAFSLLLGIALLPISLMGLLFGIGILGLSPFLAFIVYGRNGARALAAARSRSSTKTLSPSALLALVLGIFVASAPFWGHLYARRQVSNAVHQLVSGEAAASTEALATLRRYSYVVTNYDELVWAYDREKDDQRRGRMAHAYKELTGENIEIRLARLSD